MMLSKRFGIDFLQCKGSDNCSKKLKSNVYASGK